MLTKLALLLVLTAAPAAHAEWVGGGGFIVKDGANPWFLQNTPRVTACIIVDAEHFHLSPGQLAPEERLRVEYVERAIQYWEEQLDDQPYSRLEPTYPKVATQTFDFGPCADDTDVRFQFGVLTKEQIAALKAQGQDPREIISLAVRTAYDRVHMRGRGFVYIAADSGELKPNEAAMSAQLGQEVAAACCSKF